jgi:uncharacterized Zn-finger protein
LRELSKKQKLHVPILIVDCVLIFYASGIATNLFASPVFSMFWIISYQTAHNIVTYVAVIIAIALTITPLTINLIQKPKTLFPETHNKPVIRTIKATNEAPVRVTPPTNNQKITNNPESNKTEQKNQSAKQPIIQPTKQSTTQIPTQPNTDKNATTNQEADIKNKNKITCPTCKKEFSQPLFMLDYSSSKAKLINFCPYCNQSLGEQKTVQKRIFGINTSRP